MSFLDNITTAVSRGTAAAERTGRSAKLKMQLNDLMKQRRDLTAQLGASLYEAVKDLPEFREGREAVLDGIANIDAQRTQIETEIAEIEAAVETAAESSVSYTCPGCGTRVSATHSFCSGCGMPVAQIKETYRQRDPSGTSSGRACTACGAPMDEDDLFCMLCGTARELPAEHPAIVYTDASENSSLTSAEAAPYNHDSEE